MCGVCGKKALLSSVNATDCLTTLTAPCKTDIRTEALDIMLGTRDAINEWLQKRREQAHAEGVAKGHAQGVSDRDREWRTWNADRITAEERGEPFDEPPPGSDDARYPDTD